MEGEHCSAKLTLIHQIAIRSLAEAVVAAVSAVSAGLEASWSSGELQVAVRFFFASLLAELAFDLLVRLVGEQTLVQLVREQTGVVQLVRQLALCLVVREEVQVR